MKRKQVGAILMLALLAVAVLSGCAPKSPTFVESSKSYDQTSALQLASQVSSGDLASTPTTAAPALRHKALVNLRRQGSQAQKAAELLTQTFPSTTRAVPFYVEHAKYQSKPAWLILEAVGPAKGALKDTRVWVLDGSGEVLLSGIR